MMFVTSDVDLFRLFFECVFDETDIVQLECTPEKMSVSVLSRSHTCFYTVEFSREFFDEYDVDNVEIVTLDLDSLFKILKTCKGKEAMELSTGGYEVTIILEDDVNRRVFEIMQVDVEYAPANPPMLDNDAVAVMGFGSLKQTLTDLDIFKTGSVHVIVGDTLKFKTDELSLVDYNNTIAHEYISGVGDSIYSTEFLKKILYFNKLNDEVKFELGADVPLVWSVESSGIEVRGLIAPKVGVE